jgi:hypothetical protein
MIPPPEASFPTLEALRSYCETWAAERGYRLTKNGAAGRISRYECTQAGATKNTRKIADHERKRQTRPINCPFKMWIIHDESEDPPWRLKHHREMEPHNHDGNPVSANVGNRNRGTQSDVARSSDAPPTSDDLVREIMRLNNRAQNGTPTPADPSSSRDTAAYQTTTYPTPPIPKPTPDLGLISETFFVPRKTGNTCIVCSPCEITLDNSFSRKKHDASGKSATNPTRYTGMLIDDLDFDKVSSCWGLNMVLIAGGIAWAWSRRMWGGRARRRNRRCMSLRMRGSGGLRWRICMRWGRGWGLLFCHCENASRTAPRARVVLDSWSDHRCLGSIV